MEQEKQKKSLRPETVMAAIALLCLVGLKLNAAEQKLVRLYRSATQDQRNDALRILNGEKTEVEQLVDAMLGDKWKKKFKK